MQKYFYEQIRANLPTLNVKLLKEYKMDEISTES